MKILIDKYWTNTSAYPLLKVFLGLLATVFVAETIIMFILPFLHFGENVLAENFADALMLTILSAPFIWMLISKSKQAAKELEASENCLRLIYNSVHDAIFIHDVNGDIVDVNDKMLEMYGVSREQAEQEQKNLQVQLLHAQKMESIGQLAAGIAHEINTPAQFINANITFLDEAFQESSRLIDSLLELFEAIKEGAVTDDQIMATEDLLARLDWEYLKEDVPQAISQTKEGVQRVTSIVQAMKEFSHPGSKKKADTDLNRIINTIVAVSRNEWKYVAAVETDLDPELPLVPCFADEMGQVFLNLLVNAAHAIEHLLGNNPEAAKGRISISTRHLDHSVEVRVTDTGSGIPKNIQDRIFDPFFTTKEVGKGTGQGLTIAHDIVTGKHKGSLTFETAPDSGTTFIIRLPGRAV